MIELTDNIHEMFVLFGAAQARRMFGQASLLMPH